MRTALGNQAKFAIRIISCNFTHQMGFQTMRTTSIISPISYQDKFLWWLGYPFAALSFLFFANDNSFMDLVGFPTFIPDLLFALVLTFAVGLYIRYIVRYLDVQMPWYEDFHTRLIRQFLLGILLPLLASMCLEVGYLYLIAIPIASSGMLNLELPLAFIFLLLVNLFYLVNYLFHYKKIDLIAITTQTTRPETPAFSYFMAQKGYTEVQIPVENVAFLVSVNKIVWLHTFQQEQYRLQGTLEEWEVKLKQAHFYRINRQYIAAFKAIQSVEQTETRKLKVNFVLPTEEVYISKLNVANFRQWWKNTSPS